MQKLFVRERERKSNDERYFGSFDEKKKSEKKEEKKNVMLAKNAMVMKAHYI
jgi:hypothetical protein